MKFTTKSGSSYELTDIEVTPSGLQGYLKREGVPLVHFLSGEDMGELPGQIVYFPKEPTEGESFRYSTSTHGWAISTPVETINTEEN